MVTPTFVRGRVRCNTPPGCCPLTLRPHVSDMVRVVKVTFWNGLVFNFGFVGEMNIDGEPVGRGRICLQIYPCRLQRIYDQ